MRMPLTTSRHAGILQPKPVKLAPSPRVWLVTSKRTYFGLHVPCKDAPEMTKTNLLAFTKADDALTIRSMLCTHYACNGEWPTRIADPDSASTETRPTGIVHQPCLIM